MTVIHLSIPDDLGLILNKTTKDVNSFVTNAIRHELDRAITATDADIELASISDNSSDYLSIDELKYYLSLPSNV